MHGAAQIVEALYYGYCDKAVYLRLDLTETFLKGHPDFEIRVNVDSGSRVRLHASISGGEVKAVEFWKGEELLLVPLGTGNQVQVAFRQVFEVRLDYSILSVSPHEQVSLQVSIWINGLPLQVLPQEGWLTLELTEDLTSW